MFSHERRPFTLLRGCCWCVSILYSKRIVTNWCTMAHVSTVRHYKFYIELQPSNSEYYYWYYVLWMYNLKENVRYIQWEEFVRKLQIVMAQKPRGPNFPPLLRNLVPQKVSRLFFFFLRQKGSIKKVFFSACNFKFGETDFVLMSHWALKLGSAASTIAASWNAFFSIMGFLSFSSNFLNKIPFH